MILLRHGQSWFNHHFTLTRRDPGIEDPALTPLGEQQAEEAADALADAGIRRILASPYTRALQTAAGVVAMLVVVVSVYGGLALLLEDTRGHLVLLTGRRGRARASLEGGLGAQLESLESEAGVRNQL